MLDKGLTTVDLMTQFDECHIRCSHQLTSCWLSSSCAHADSEINNVAQIQQSSCNIMACTFVVLPN